MRNCTLVKCLTTEGVLDLARAFTAVHPGPAKSLTVVSARMPPLLLLLVACGHVFSFESCTSATSELWPFVPLGAASGAPPLPA